MINAIISAISSTLNSTFGDRYKVHMEDIKQGLKEPCFFITCLAPKKDQLVGQRWLRKNQFCIQYFPETRRKIRECNEVAEKLLDCLEYITIPGEDRPIRGTKMSYEVADDMLHFFINYDLTTKKIPETINMGDLSQNVKMKK